MCLEMQEETKAGETTRRTVRVDSDEEVDRLDEKGPSDDRKQVKKPQQKCLDKY